MSDATPPVPPILSDKHHDTPSAFTPESLLREARRQKADHAAGRAALFHLDRPGVA